MPKGTITGLILAGGESRRFGRDKSALLIHGLPAADRLKSSLRPCCEEILVSVKGPLPEGPGYVADLTPGMGPLSGIQAGLRAAQHEWCLVAACDMPFLSTSLVQLLASHVCLDVQAVTFEEDGFVIPFPGLYRKTIIPHVEEALEGGQLSVWRLLRRARTLLIPLAEARAADPCLSSFVNLNTPQDLAALPHRGLAAGQIPR